MVECRAKTQADLCDYLAGLDCLQFLQVLSTQHTSLSKAPCSDPAGFEAILEYRKILARMSIPRVSGPTWNGGS